MKLIVGLGNPGAQYENTRHNIGFRVADELVHRLGGEYTSWENCRTARTRTSGDSILIAKPQSFMNLSGFPVTALLGYYKIELPSLLVVADDVNLPLGRLRARARGSEGGHNGLRSIIEQLGTEEFARLRVGVGRGDKRRDLADHVLAKFEPDEREEIERAIGRAADAAELFLADGIVRMMNAFNSKGLENQETEN